MIREIKYTVLDDSGTQKISPSTKQWAGMQYENNATKVSFDITALVGGGEDAKIKNPLCRIDFNSSSAGYDPDSALVPQNTEGKYIISREIPIKYTQYGGEMQITAVVINLKDNSNTVTGNEMVAYSFPVTVNFTAVKKDSLSQAEIVKNISALEQEVKETAENAENAIEQTKNTALSEIAEEKSKVTKVATIAITSAANAEKYANEVEDIKAELETELTIIPKIYKGVAFKDELRDENGVFIVEATDENGLLNAKEGDIYIDRTNWAAFKLVMKLGKKLKWMKINYADQTFNPNSKNAQSGVAVAEAVENKEDKSNKVTDLSLGTDKLTHEQYPSAKATSEFVNNLGSVLSELVEQVRNMVLSVNNKKEDISNKVSSIYDHYNDADKYPNAPAVLNLTNQMATALQEDYNGKLGNKVDKEEGKTLYRGMDVIFEGTIGENGIDEGISVLTVKEDMSRNAFKLDEIYFYINSATELTTEQSLSLIFNGGSGIPYYWFSTTVPKGKKRVQAYGKRVKEKHWFNMQQAPCFSLYETEFSGSYAMSSVDYVTKLKIDGLTNFKAGTKILFCGRRVD